MARTLLDLFKDPTSYKYGTDYNNEVTDKPKGDGFVAGIRNYAEQELNGLRIQAAKSIVTLYGTQLIRVTKQRTELVDDMKVSTGGTRRGGLIGALTSPLGKVKEKISDVLGLPEIAIPTFVVDEGSSSTGTGNQLFTENRGLEQDTMIYLGQIRKDAGGSGLGKLLKQNAKGTPKQILSQTVGAGIKAGKKAVRGALFGRGTTLGSNDPVRNVEQGTIYGSSDLLNDVRYTKTMEDSTQYDSTVSPILNVKGEREQTISDSVSRVKALGDKAPKPSDLKLKPLTTPNLNLSKKPSFGIGSSLEAKPPKFTPVTNIQVYGKNEEEGEYSYTQANEDYIRAESTENDILFKRPSDLDGSSNNWLDESKLSYSGYNSFNTKRKNDRNVDYLINGDGYKYKSNLKKIFEKGRVITDENIDTIVVKIGDIRFHYAVITGISETLSPSWTSFRMIGSPFNSHMYDSIERSVQFTLKLYPNNPLEHKQNWDNINKLSKLVYPYEYIGVPGAVRPPVTNLTLGDMYNNKFGFIESLSYSFDDESSWELGRGQTEIDEYAELFDKQHSPFGGTFYETLRSTDSTAWDAVQTLNQVVNYKLPKVIEISITFKFIESRQDSEQSIIYAFKPAT